MCITQNTFQNIFEFFAVIRYYIYGKLLTFYVLCFDVGTYLIFHKLFILIIFRGVFPTKVSLISNILMVDKRIIIKIVKRCVPNVI